MTIENYNDNININKIRFTKSSFCYSENVLGDGKKRVWDSEIPVMKKLRVYS